MGHCGGWTHRVMKSYFGKAFLDENANKIKINKILNSPDIEQHEELLKFVVYHEMLHFSISRFHNKEFRQVENNYLVKTKYVQCFPG